MSTDKEIMRYKGSNNEEKIAAAIKPYLIWKDKEMSRGYCAFLNSVTSMVTWVSSFESMPVGSVFSVFMHRDMDADHMTLGVQYNGVEFNIDDIPVTYSANETLFGKGKHIIDTSKSIGLIKKINKFHHPGYVNNFLIEIDLTPSSHKNLSFVSQVVTDVSTIFSLNKPGFLTGADKWCESSLFLLGIEIEDVVSQEHYISVKNLFNEIVYNTTQHSFRRDSEIEFSIWARDEETMELRYKDIDSTYYEWDSIYKEPDGLYGIQWFGSIYKEDAELLKKYLQE